MPKRMMIVSGLLFVLQISYAGTPVTPVPLGQYREFARTAADWTWEHQDSLLQVWKKGFDAESIFGYRPPPRLLEMASIYAFLYDQEGIPEYAERAKGVLIRYGDYRKQYPKKIAAQRPDYGNGVPALPDFFTTMRYIKPYEVLKKHDLISQKEQKEIEAIIAHSIEYTLQSQEWGAMNRAALRAETLAWAVRALPDHPRAKYWASYAQALRSDNWGQWEIEDAQIYHAVWLYSLIGYADATGEIEELFKLPEMYYYAHYFLNLMCPDGMIPDFGDANWHANWPRYLVFFEAAANAYQDRELKWAAATIAQKFIDFENTTSVGLGYLLLDCYRYGDDRLMPLEPQHGSMEVMEDLVGKKMVLRSGWDAESTYLLLNYRDEGDGGLLFRDYLRDGIPVEEEKLTHGHSDENSIALLMNGGSVLLHDGGYRDYMPSGMWGAYRADYFHNRVCVRPEKIWMGQEAGQYRYSPSDHPEIEGQKVLDFLHNAGSYRQVRTQKIDFLTFDDFDYARTRLIDDKLGYQWDRVIAYIKDPEIFVVFDVVKATEEEWFTAANLWHTRQVVASGEHWYDTRYDSLQHLALNTANNLLIYFPKNHYRLEAVEAERRYYQDEWVIAEYSGQHFKLGQHITFATVLIPHASSEDPASWIDRISYIGSEPVEQGTAVEIDLGNRTIMVGIKNDLHMDMIRDYRRPKYTYESGKLVFGPFESNADFFYTNKTGSELEFTAVNLSKVVYEDQVLFDQQPGLFGLAFDGSSDMSGIGKARYWRDKVDLKQK